MKITRLQRLKGYRIFRDFSWPNAGLPDFARFNVIYGWNGSGKTSLSNLFRQIQLKERVTEGDVEILVDQIRVSGSTFDTAALPAVRVFNRDTVSRNIFDVPNQQFPPVFFLGEDSVEKQKRIVELKKKLESHLKEQARGEHKQTGATTALDTHCSEQAKAIKNLLTVAGGGPFNNYNAANYKAAIQRIAETNPVPVALTDAQRDKYLSSKNGQPLDRLEELTIEFPDITTLTSRTLRILEQSIVSTVLTSLTENPVVASWVNTGLSLHTGSNATDTCHFCDQPLPADRIGQLEGHFNDAFKQFQSDIDSLISDIGIARDFTRTLQHPSKNSLYPHLRTNYTTAVSNVQSQTGIVNLYFDALRNALTAKKEEPFKNIELMPFFTNPVPPSEPSSTLEKIFQAVIAGTATLSSLAGKSAFDKLNELIKQHNRHTEDFDKTVASARTALAQDEVLKSFKEWQTKSTDVQSAGDQINSARTDVKNVKAGIAALESEVLQHRRPADELNREVAAYLGRDELRFDVEQNGYRIMRNGQPASHLSEGERTAIAFLYFLKSLSGTDFDISTGIVVIDDPVSSLDANSLFSAFGFMKHRTSSPGQLFVLTHNFTFFRQIRNWYYNLQGQKKDDISKRPARFYMLSQKYDNGQRSATIEVLDPFLHQYESEYHYLFKRVYEEAQKPNGQGLETYYGMSNIARRLLESFLAFRVPERQGELYQKLEAVQYDQATKTRILRFLHTYSHFDQIAEPDHDLSALSETPAIMRDVLALIEGVDAAHHLSMVSLVNP